MEQIPLIDRLPITIWIQQQKDPCGQQVHFQDQHGQIAANIQSGDFDINEQGMGGDGDVIMSIRRIVPDFLTQTGDATVTLNLKNYPTDSQASSSLGPFTTTTSTTKIDTRARARAVSLKVSNSGVGQHWKLGTFRLDLQPDGRR